MIRIIGPKDPKEKDAINTTSISNNWSKGLSPFFLGPVKCYDGLEATCVENCWQFAKVYQNHVDVFDDPTDEYFAWREKGWSDKKAHRYPMGKNAKPLYSFWAGKRYTYIEARKNIYIPVYAGAVKKSSAFAQLKEIYQKNKDIVLWDFDGYYHHKLGMTYDEIINCETRKCGHAFVISMLLEKFL